MISVLPLAHTHEKAYEAFLSDMEHTLFYHSNRFRVFLRAFLEADDHYLLAFEDGEIRGALPVFRIKSSMGTCLNSLPFFGSNGGIIERHNSQEVRSALLEAFYDLAYRDRVLAATIITSPFESHHKTYDRFFGQGPVDHRIGQITELPCEEKDPGGLLMDNLDRFTRRMIRKAMKNEIRVTPQNNQKAMDFLAQVHHQNMARIGGKTKPEAFFRTFPTFFRKGTDYTIWTAWLGDQIIAALLLFYYNKTVEYYIPAILYEYRSIQPQSLIVYRAMLDAAEKGYRYWNWGGTWPSQEGVYRFKKRWNTQNLKYHYYHTLFENGLVKHSRKEILRAFPYAYVIPFDRLEESR